MTDQELEELKILWKKGVKSVEIGEQFGVSGAYVRMLALKFRLKPRIITERRPEVCRELGLATSHEIPEYRNWIEVRRRSQRPRAKDARSYTSRGIGLAESWEDFTNFYRDMGPKPTPRHTVERVDNEKGYGPENCRWATMQEQANNRRSNRIVVFEGVPMSLANAIRAAGSHVKIGTASRRIIRNWDPILAITTPVRKPR